MVGCKTGYTDDARSCLVSCAEKNGMKLICVVMKDEAPYHYRDTISLFEYGFSNFEKVYVSQTETRYNIDNTGLFYSGNDIFGSSQPFLSLNKDDFIILPRTISFEDVESSISYETADANQAAVITYAYQGLNLGSVRVDFTVSGDDSSIFDMPSGPEETSEKEDGPIVFVNVTVIIIGCAVLGGALLIWLIIHIILKNYNISPRSGRRSWRKRNRHRRRRARKHKDYDF